MIRTRHYKSQHLMSNPINLSHTPIPQLIAHGIRYSILSPSMGLRLMTMYSPILHDKMFMLKAQSGKLIDYYETCKAEITLCHHRKIVEFLKNTLPTEFTINEQFDLGHEQIDKFVTWCYELSPDQYEKIMQKLDSQSGFSWSNLTNIKFKQPTQPEQWFKRKVRKPMNQRATIDCPQLKQILTTKEKFNLHKDFGSERVLMQKINKHFRAKEKEILQSKGYHHNQKQQEEENGNNKGDENQEDDLSTISFFSMSSYREFDELVDDENIGEKFKLAKNGRKILKIDPIEYMIKDMIYGQEEQLDDLVNNLIAQKMLENMQSNKKQSRSKKNDASNMNNTASQQPQEPTEDKSNKRKTNNKKNTQKNLSTNEVKKQPVQNNQIIQENNTKNSQPVNESSNSKHKTVVKSQDDMIEKLQQKLNKKKKKKNKQIKGFSQTENFTLNPVQEWNQNEQIQEEKKNTNGQGQKSVDFKNILGQSIDQSTNKTKKQSVVNENSNKTSTISKSKKSKKQQSQQDEYKPSKPRKSSRNLKQVKVKVQESAEEQDANQRIQQEKPQQPVKSLVEPAPVIRTRSKIMIKTIEKLDLLGGNQNLQQNSNKNEKINEKQVVFKKQEQNKPTKENTQNISISIQQPVTLKKTRVHKAKQDPNEKESEGQIPTNQIQQYQQRQVKQKKKSKKKSHQRGDQQPKDDKQKKKKKKKSKKAHNSQEQDGEWNAA